MLPRNTKTKALVVNLFESNLTPLTITATYDLVKKTLPKTAYSTVYRITQQLIKTKKLVALDWKDRGGRFEWAQRKHHHHLVCNQCGKITDIDDTLLNLKLAQVSQKTGFRIKEHDVELFGICHPCQTKL